MEELIKKYIEKNPNEEIHLVDKIFGKGNLLINFNYKEPYLNFKQCYLARVDKDAWCNDKHDVMQEVEDYLADDGIGVIDKEDFVNDYNEDFDADITLEDVEGDDELSKKYEDWFKEQFPKIDLEYGGVCFFDAVS